MASNNPIGIFDSGIGGVTVLKEIIKILPKEDYIYYSDSKNNPYGDKSNQEIIQICKNIVERLIQKNCKAIVIACNTASTRTANILRKEYAQIPIIAIEPAYKMVYDFAYDKPTLVMATKGTIESERFNFLYHKYNNHKTYLLPCIGLADIIEEGNQEKLKKYLKENLSPYRGIVNNVVLGCTHYPLIEQEIKEILGEVLFFNGSPRVALHLKEILKEKQLLSTENNMNITFIDTQNQKQKEDRFFTIIKN